MGIGFVLKAAIALAVLFTLIAVPICSDESDADVPEYSGEITLDIGEPATIDLQDYLGGSSYNYCSYTKYSGDSKLPPGITKDGSILSGTPTELGSYHLQFRFNNSYVSLVADAILNFDITVTEVPEEFTVTYDAGIGTVNGSARWSETITENTFASLPDASYYSGAYTFRGWSLYETSTDTIGSLRVMQDVTLYAVWERNTVDIDPITATITQDQSSTMPVTTDPDDARLSISNYGGLSAQNALLAGRYLVLNMTGVQPGTYYVTVSASSTGYYTGSTTVTVMVPITIVKPIEYTLVSGDVFSYTPVTNPSNASIALTGVTIDGKPADTGLRVNGRTITGTLTEPGTYEITYRAYMDGYVEVSNTVIVYVSDKGDVPSTGDVSLASITAASRASEPRVFDFVAIGGRNVSNYVWTVDGEVFATSSDTALYEFPSSGIYTVGCTARGYDGSEVTLEITVICTDNYHREAAWSGVEYAYIVEGEVRVEMPDPSPFSHTTETIDGRTYTILSGTPSESDVGKTFDVTVGVKATFTGLHASFHRFDFDNDGVYEDGSDFTYDRPGRYSIVCNAVNNISEVTSTVHVEVEILPQEDTTLGELTDFEMGVGERMYIAIAVDTGDVLSVSGTAASFVTVEGSTLKVAPTEAGVFGLTVTLSHPDAPEESVTIKVTVKQPGVPEPKPEGGDYTLAMVVIFIVGVGLIAGFLIYDTRTGKVSAKYRSLKSRTMNRNRTDTNRYTGNQRFQSNSRNRNNGGRWR